MWQESWLGGRDSNRDSQIQSLESYHWTTSQQRNRIYGKSDNQVNRSLHRVVMQFECGTRILRVSHGRDARATSPNVPTLHRLRARDSQKFENAIHDRFESRLATLPVTSRKITLAL